MTKTIQETVPETNKNGNEISKSVSNDKWIRNGYTVTCYTEIDHKSIQNEYHVRRHIKI